MDNDNHALIVNFLRRWSTIDITLENKILFEEHLASVKVLTGEKGETLLQGLDERATRDAFVLRLRTVQGF